MRTLLRHTSTGRYYQSAGAWTLDPENAHDFGSIARAVSVVQTRGLSDMEVDLTFDNPEQVTSVCFKELVLGF